LADMVPVIEEHLRFVDATQADRGWLDGFRPRIHLSLVSMDGRVDHFQSDRFLSTPSMRFVLPVNPDSLSSLESSLIEVLSVIQHELVHFSAAFGDVGSAAGHGKNEQVNEEVLANLVQQCDRLAMLSNFQGGSASVSLPRPAENFSGDMGKALTFARSVGPSAEGEVIARWFFLGSVAEKDGPLSEADYARLSTRCAVWTAKSRDFVSIFHWAFRL